MPHPSPDTVVRHEWKRLDADALRAWPLPDLARDADKESRGRVLIIGGSREIAGAALLAAEAALRAGAGKLVIATVQSASTALSIAMPEARVIGLPETPDGSIAPAGAALLEQDIAGAAAILVGPGLTNAAASAELASAVAAHADDRALVLDAGALKCLAQRGRLDHPALLTPHAGEMASLLGWEKDEVRADPPRAALEASRRWNAVVALKGATTLLAAPGGECWRHEGGHPGLGTSGSGDVLAGMVAGFAARGASLAQAAAWGIVIHALAGRQLARTQGPIGFLARELAREAPALIAELG